MKSRHSIALRLALALSLTGTSVLTAAQSRSVQPVPQPSAPAANAGSALPNPSGLSSPFPAGLPSPSPNPAGLPDPTVPNVSVPGTPPGTPPIDGDVAINPPTGGLAYGAPARLAPQRAAAGPAGPYTAMQLAQSFLGADGNGDGELTRAEAMRLAIAPYSFEEMDRNYDGVISRFEYEDATR